MLKIHRFHFVAIGIVATLVTGCAVDPNYYDDGPSHAPVYRDGYRSPYYGSSPSYYDGDRSHGHGHSEYRQRDNYQRNDWRDREDQGQRNRPRPDRRDDHDARPDGARPDGARPPRNPPQGNAQPPRPNPPPKAHDNPAPRPTNPPGQQPPRTKSDRYNPKTGQYLPSASDMP